MKVIPIINSLIYCIYGTRYWLTGVETGLSFMNPITSLAILAVFMIIFTAIAMVSFDKTTVED